MAASSQSIRYCPPPASSTGGGIFESFNRALSDLCTRGIPKDGTTAALKQNLEEATRDLSGEAVPRFMEQLHERVSTLLDSNDVAENLGALRAIAELIEVPLGENASKVSKISTYMRRVLEMKRDPEVLVLASKVLGHLAGSAGAMAAEEVDYQIRNALSWLRGDRADRRFAAVLILKISKHAKIALICVVALLAMFAHSSYAQDSAQDFLDAHNEARQQVGIEAMEWDDTVAEYAQSYASQRVADCNMVHSGSQQYGENIAWSSGDLSGTDAVKMWVDEKSYYDYGSNTCAEGQQCGHYTQVVWRNSKSLGCAKVRCNSGGTFITCNYSPRGNYVGEKPY